MSDKTFESNKVVVAGEVVSDFRFSHEVYGEGFYLVDLSVSRLSDSADVIPVMISDRLIDVKEEYKGKIVEVSGQFRSYNHHDANQNKLLLSVFAREIREISAEEGVLRSNEVILSGYICKKPIYRKTPLGREIADILLAVNRPYGKSDYIPCICWGRNARFAGNLEIGSNATITGRIQSREYQKRISENETEKRIAYEVSVSKIETEAPVSENEEQ